MLVLPAASANAVGAAAVDGTVTVSVTGKGDVTGTGISCNETGGPDCSEFYPDTTYQECDPERKPPCFTVSENPVVELTAGPDRNGYAFSAWVGCGAAPVTLRTCSLAVDANKSLTAQFSDVTNPVVTGLSPGSGAHRGTITLSASASDNSGTINRVEFRVAGTLVGVDPTAPYAVSFNTASANNGPAAVQATAFDGGGRSSSVSATITIDNAPPTVTIAGPNGQTFGPGTTQTWTFTTNDAHSGVLNVECSVVPAGSPHAFAACSGGSSHSVTNRPHGTHAFAVRVRDAAGNELTQTRSFSIDAVGPETTITGGPAAGSTVASAAPTFTFESSESGSTFACRIYLAGTTAPAFAPCSGAGSHTASGLSDGMYTFDVRAVDAVGNQDPTHSSRTWTVDTTAPQTTIDSAPPSSTQQTSAVFAFSSSEPGSTFACSLDGSAFAPCSSGQSYSSLGVGSHTFQVRATDAVGNQDATPAQASWAVTAPPPPPPPPVVCKVPGVKGKTLAAAKSALAKANCATGKITRVFSTRAKKGKVVRQSIAAGAVRPKGTKVALTVGKGPRS